MPRIAQPLAVIEANGRTHLSEAEKQERRERELHVPFTDVQPPDYLSEKQKEKFSDIADKLLALKIMSELDIDCLARYVLAHDLYLAHTKRLSRAIKSMDVDELKDFQNLQDKAFKQAQSAARDLGLTISSRCRLVVPQPPPEDDEL